MPNARRLPFLRPLLQTACAVLLTLFAPGVLTAQPAPTEGRLFTVLIFERASDLARRTDPKQSDAYWTAYDDFAGHLAQQGALRGGSALSESQSALVRGQRGADAGDVRLGGYFVIAAPDLATAQRLSQRAPAFAVGVEVRPHRDNPHMQAPRGN